MLKPIPDFPNYFAEDTTGLIYSTNYRWCDKLPREPRIKAQRLSTNGYYATDLRRDNKSFTFLISHLILLTFVGPRPKGMWACHGKKGRYVNSLDNVYWATPSQNHGADKVRDGTNRHGEKCSYHRVTELAVRVMRRSYGYRGKNGLSLYALADIFGLNHVTVFEIIHRKIWKHI